MNVQERNKKYNAYVDAKKPKTKNFPTLIYAYIVGGVICMIGQGVNDGLMALFPTMSIESANSWMLIILIFIASFLTGLGVYDRIGVFAGAGSIVPITGFSNSITSPAIEFKKEGLIFDHTVGADDFYTFPVVPEGAPVPLGHCATVGNALQIDTHRKDRIADRSYTGREVDAR